MLAIWHSNIKVALHYIAWLLGAFHLSSTILGSFSLMTVAIFTCDANLPTNSRFVEKVSLNGKYIGKSKSLYFSKLSLSKSLSCLQSIFGKTLVMLKITCILIECTQYKYLNESCTKCICWKYITPFVLNFIFSNNQAIFSL